MNVHAESSESTQVDEFRNSHVVWKEANDSFHDRFQKIITAGTSQDLDTLAHDFVSKFDHFMRCSKAFVAGNDSTAADGKASSRQHPGYRTDKYVHE